MIDFNNSEFPSIAFLRVELASEIELVDETFGVYCNQQGDVIAGLKRATNKHVQVLIETLVFDGENKIVFDSRSNHSLSYSVFSKKRLTLKAGIYTIVIKPYWGEYDETSSTNVADYRRFLVSLYYPKKA